MSGKTAMSSGFFCHQSLLRGYNHLRRQPAGRVFGFDERKLGAAGPPIAMGAFGDLKNKFQPIGNQVLESPALQGGLRLGLAEKVVRQLDGGSHEAILAY
jgi:hypothetical protein